MKKFRHAEIVILSIHFLFSCSLKLPSTYPYPFFRFNHFTGNQQRVLVLDDHEGTLEVVTEALRYEQFDVLGIREGRQLLKNVADFSPQLILLDYKLADANGGDLCSQLKELEHLITYDVVIIVCLSNSYKGKNGGALNTCFLKLAD